MNAKQGGLTRRGFTILELLVVISVMAVLASLATGAAIKAVKQGRNKRVDATIKALEMALMNYRAQENRWPVSLNPQKDSSSVWFHGIENAQVFKPLYDSGSGASMVYLDGSALFTRTGGRRMTLREALNQKKKDIPLGYPLPANQNIFCCFCIEFNLLTDSVKVHRPDMRQAPYQVGNRVEGAHTCPNGLWGKVN